MNARLVLPVVLCLILFAGCRTTEITEREPVPVEHLYRVEPVDAQASSVEWLSMYRGVVSSERNRTLAEITTPLDGGGPESPLWNLMSDLFRYRATLIAETYVHVALLDPDRFQLDLERGPVTSGDLYHFYPSPDQVTVLGITPEQVHELANQIARTGPVPMSGLRMVISGTIARNVVLDYADLMRDGLYHVAIPTPLLEDDRYPVLNEAVTSVKYDVRVRDLIAAHMRSRGSVEAFRDLRLRMVAEPDCEGEMEALAARCL